MMILNDDAPPLKKNHHVKRLELNRDGSSVA